MPREIGTPAHFGWLKGIVGAVLVLNLFDGAFTIYWVFTGMAVEANPFMAELINKSPVLFIVGKLSLVFLGSFLLWRRRNHRMSVIAIFLIFLLYYFVLIYHLRAFDLQLMTRIFG